MTEDEVKRLVETMPDDVQIIIRAPHYAVSHNSRVYYQKMLVKKKVAPFIISSCETEMNDVEFKESEMKLLIKNQANQIDELKKQLDTIKNDKTGLEEKIESLKNSYHAYKTESQMLLNE